jgi:hypothetical protein
MSAYPITRPVRAVMLVLALTAFGTAAHAQQPSAAAIATARELITVKGAAALYEPLVRGVIEQARGTFLQTNPMLGKPLSEVAAKLRAEYSARTVELVVDMAKLYATRFTEQELKDVLAFYKSPLGRKMLSEEPAILDQSMKNAQTWADKLAEEIIGKFRSEMRKLGHDI